MNSRRSHDRNQSRLYKITSPHQLSERLLVDIDVLRKLEDGRKTTFGGEDKKTGRPIQSPKPLLKKVHVRVARLLSSIEAPDFLYSAIKGRSYISNALQHSSDLATVKIDVRKFYPSTRAQAIYHFFRDRMHCDGDVAGILAKILTVDGHLATGSNASPILSFFMYEDMFLEIDALAKGRGCIMTCYIDDMVFSGPNAGRKLVYDVIQIVRRYRLWGHKTKGFKPGQPKVITGVAVTKAGARLPNRRQRAIADDLAELAQATEDERRLELMDRLVSRMHEAAQIDPSWLPRARAMANERRGIKRRASQRAVRHRVAMAGFRPYRSGTR